tara:strand:- start:7709 stop:7942 length:234 start_codon:yes stop_codon:yes gene_type:complete
MTTLNNFHTRRYSDFFERAGGGSIGKPVADIYRFESQLNPEVSNRRGMDSRDIVKDQHRVERKLKDFSRVILDRPLG